MHLWSWAKATWYLGIPSENEVTLFGIELNHLSGRVGCPPKLYLPRYIAVYNASLNITDFSSNGTYSNAALRSNEESGAAH